MTANADSSINKEDQMTANADSSINKRSAK
jgi:hypothetical protein